VADFSHPELSRVIRATQISPAMTGEERVKLMKLTWDAVGTEFASRHLQYEMFYAGGQYVTRGHSYRTYDWGRATQMAKNVTESYQIEDFLGGSDRAA